MIINCFYHSKFSYTIVPWQIEEDIQRIAQTGASVITLNVLEQDWKAARENIMLVMKLARRVGLKVYFTPEAWLGRFHTVNGFPSVFTVKNLDTAIKNEGGAGYHSSPIGPVSDWTHPKTEEFLHQKLEECFAKFGFDGIVWDQPLILPADINMNPSIGDYFSNLNDSIRRNFGAVDVIWHEHPAANAALINSNMPRGLTLPPKEFIFFDHRGYKDSQVDNMTNVVNELLDEAPAMFGYYDYPANVSSPKKAMEMIAKCLKQVVSS